MAEMITAGDFRKGVTIEMEGNIYNIVEFLHVKPGKGSAFVRTKIKNIVTGSVLERTFNPTDRVIKATIETKKMQYLYNDGELFYFMDNETYDQIPLNKSQVEDALVYVRENDIVTIKFYKGEAFSVEPDNFVVLQIVECEPGVKGDTATNVTKQAKTETGAVVNVPIFINEGEYIRIDTRSGEYMERVNNVK